MRRLLALAALAVGALASAPSAATLAPAPLARLLEPIRARTGVPALGAALLRGDRLVGLGVVGVRRIGNPEPVTADDAWVLASCTKAMTATLAARLVEAGKIAWDTRIADALPGIEMEDAYRGATLEQLLAHRAGVPRDVSATMTGAGWWVSLLSPLWPLVLPRAIADRRASLVAGALRLTPSFTPGSYGYSNVGYVVAGAMLEAAGGASWEALMDRELFAPLGMSAGFGVPGLRAEDRGATSSRTESFARSSPGRTPAHPSRPVPRAPSRAAAQRLAFEIDVPVAERAVLGDEVPARPARRPARGCRARDCRSRERRPARG